MRFTRMTFSRVKHWNEVTVDSEDLNSLDAVKNRQSLVNDLI